MTESTKFKINGAAIAIISFFAIIVFSVFFDIKTKPKQIDPKEVNFHIVYFDPSTNQIDTVLGKATIIDMFSVMNDYMKDLKSEGMQPKSFHATYVMPE